MTAHRGKTCLFHAYFSPWISINHGFEINHLCEFGPLSSSSSSSSVYWFHPNIKDYNQRIIQFLQMNESNMTGQITQNIQLTQLYKQKPDTMSLYNLIIYIIIMYKAHAKNVKFLMNRDLLSRALKTYGFSFQLLLFMQSEPLIIAVSTQQCYNESFIKIIPYPPPPPPPPSHQVNFPNSCFLLGILKHLCQCIQFTGLFCQWALCTSSTTIFVFQVPMMHLSVFRPYSKFNQKLTKTITRSLIYPLLYPLCRPIRFQECFVAPSPIPRGLPKA